MMVNGAETVWRASNFTTKDRGGKDFLKKETFMLDLVECVGICSEGEWKDGILVTEAQKELVKHLVWLD